MSRFKVKSPLGKIIYEDDSTHFENAVLRLLSLNIDLFYNWLKLSEETNEKNILTALSKGYQQLKPIKQLYFDRDILCNSIAENINFGIAKNIAGTIGWLVKFNGEKYIRETTPPIYEETYFEGDKSIAGGYGQYLEQADWRLEKAKRQINDIIKITGINSGNVLDVGSGYGYFRKALDDASFKHEGIEISSFACNIAKNLYGFDTHQGIVSDYINKFNNKFDIITLWDVIEHISDYDQFLQNISSMVKSGGFVIIKTPNINCPEVNVFGPHYHSFKREHLVYFSNTSILDCAKKAGLYSHLSLSVSHLLVGFVGEETTNKWAQSLKGSDLIIYLKKK